MGKINKIKKSTVKVSDMFQIVLNISLILLALALCAMLAKELFYFMRFSFFTSGTENQYMHFERILIFFLYFEFISMIVKYFRENYHFPLRYFLYIGITAMIRLVIVDHDNPVHTLLHTCAILVLIISYFIVNSATLRKQQSKEENRV